MNVGNWPCGEGAPPSDAESVAIARVSVLAAHSLQTPRLRVAEQPFHDEHCAAPERWDG